MCAGRRLSLADLGKGCAGCFFPWENRCLLGKDRIYQGLALHTTLRECVCGLKEETSLTLLPQAGRSARWFPDSFSLRWPDAVRTSFLFPEGPAAFWVSASCLRSLSLWTPIFRSLFSPSSFWNSDALRAVQRTDHTAFFTAYLQWTLICSFLFKISSSWQVGLMTFALE